MKFNERFSNYKEKLNYSKWRSFVLGALLTLTPSANPTSGQTNALETKGLQGNTELVEDKSTTLSLDATWVAQDESGQRYFNLTSLIAPLHLEVSYSNNEKDPAFIKIPYRYSRLFDTAEALNPEEREQLVENIRKQLLTELSDKLIFWNWTTQADEVYRYNNRDDVDGFLKSFEINHINITGLASPEGPNEKGAQSIAPGNIDPENIELAKHRAGDMDQYLREALGSLGIDTDQIANINAKEVQFNDQEIEQLYNLALESGVQNSVNELEAIYILIRQYNDAEEMDSEVKEKLDQIIGQKRMVEIEIEYSNDQKTKHVIPLPLLLLGLIPLLRYRRRFRVWERFSPTTSDDTGSGMEDITPRQEEDNIRDPEYLTAYELARNSVEYMENRQAIYNRLLLDEINPFLGTSKDDVGYMGIIQRLAMSRYIGTLDHQSRSFVNRSLSEEDLQGFVFNLLKRWERNDNLVRNFNPTGQHRYWQDPQKIIHAMVAMEALVHYMYVIYPDYETYRSRKGNFNDAYELIATQVRELLDEGDANRGRRNRTRRVDGFYRPHIHPRNFPRRQEEN